MSFGFFKKLVDIAKKVGSGVAKVAKKVWQVGKPIVGAVMPAIESSGHPAGAVAGRIWRTAAPIADQILGSR